MPITGPIPLPETGMDAFLNQLQRGQENKYRQALTQQAQANAQRAQVISNLLNGALSGQQGGTNAGGASQSNNGMDMLYRLGILKPTPQELANIQVATEGKKQLQKETQESAYSQLPLNASFTALDKIFTNPKYKNIAGTATSYAINAKPGGFPLGAMLQKNLPSIFSPEDAKLLSSASTHMGNIVVGVGQKFKGPMKQLTANYIDNMKPTEADSPEVQKAKVTQLKILSDLADRQNERIDELSRQGMDPTQAIIQSTKELMPEFQKIVSDSVSEQPDQQQQQQAPQEPAVASSPQASGQNYSPQNLSNQAQQSGEGIANVPAPQQSTPKQAFVTKSEVDALAKRKGKTKTEIVALLLKKGHKVEGMPNAKQ